MQLAPSKKAGAATLPMIPDNCSTDGVSNSSELTTRFEGCDDLCTSFVSGKMIQPRPGLKLNVPG
jgi:hypothetical protein